jgi:glucose 1-dehydrogenase
VLNRRPQEEEKVAEEIRRCGTNATTFKADISKGEQVAAMFEEAKSKFGTVDILVNNAGVQKDAPIDKMTLAQWQLVMDINLTGQFLCAREPIREFKRRGVRKEISCAAGKIICVSSVHEVIPWAGHVNYAASKGGVMLMMKSIAQEVAPYRIRVNSDCPGAIRTPINMEAWDTPEAYNALLNLIPYKRIGEPRDIGQAAVWLASDESENRHTRRAVARFKPGPWENSCGLIASCSKSNPQNPFQNESTNLSLFEKL